MKRILVAAILGIAATVPSSFGQGYIIMLNYVLYNGVTPLYSPVAYNDGRYVGSEFNAQLVYRFGSMVNFVLATDSRLCRSQVVS